MMATENRAKNRKPYNIHATDVHLKRDYFKELLDNRGLEYIQFFEKVKEEYGLDMEYKGFMSLLQNRSAWKLLYAWAIAESLNVKLNDLFEAVEVDVEKKIKEKEEWNQKYGKRKKGK